MAGFVLGGGTALAEFYLGHRLSDDLDLFTNRATLVRSVGPAIPKILQDCDTALATAVRASHSLQWRYEVSSSKAGEVTLLEIANAEPPYRGEAWDVEGAKVASFNDLVIGKVVAFTERTEAKDIVDLWAIRQAAGLDFSELEGRLRQEDPRFIVSPDRLARALQRAATALDGLAFPQMLKGVDKAELKRFLDKEAHSAAKRLLP